LADGLFELSMQIDLKNNSTGVRKLLLRREGFMHCYTKVAANIRKLQ